jgi:uncharacterized protein YjeT (DUF2065 family)
VLVLVFVDVALSHKLYTQFFSLLCFALALTYVVYGLDPATYLPARWKRAGHTGDTALLPDREGD